MNLSGQYRHGASGTSLLEKARAPKTLLRLFEKDRRGKKPSRKPQLCQKKKAGMVDRKEGKSEKGKFVFIFIIIFFLGPHLEVPRLGVEPELWLLA